VPPFRTLVRAILVGTALGTAVASVMVTEGALHIWERPPASVFASGPEWRPPDSTWQTVQIAAADGVELDAWLLTPSHPNGAVVTLLHGVGDTRTGTLGYADFLLRAGYATLLPDARGHGSSGGTAISYGVREAVDLRRWSDWLCAQHPEWRQYGLGVSLGAAILLESLARPGRFHSVVAESPFATFKEVAYDRLATESGLPAPVFWPVVQVGFLYARCRYGIDLRKASPADAVRTTSVPILLIHGARDTHIPLRHSLELRSLNPRAVRLWVIPDAEHVECLQRGGREYQRRVLAWFETN
jgi:uncharacterized protein